MQKNEARLALLGAPLRSEPRATASDPTASVARKASQRRHASGAAEARQRRRDKHRRRVRRRTKRSMWRKIWVQAFARRSMWRCLTMTSTSRTSDALLLFGHAVVAPMLLSPLSALDELSLTLICRFAFDIFTIIQQDYSEASDDHTSPDLGLEGLA